MSDFDPDKYLAEKTESKDFNPDQYLQEKSVSAEPAAPEISKLQSAGQGALQGATGGFSDELGGVMGAAMEKVADLIGKGTGDKKSLKELYQEYRDMHRNRNKEAEEANPGSYLAGNVGGALGTAVLAPGVLAPKTIAGAAALGAGAGLGTSEQDLTEPSVDTLTGTAKDVAMGAGLGAAGGALGKVINKGISKVLNPENLEIAGSKLASKAVGLKPSKELTRVYNPETGTMEQSSNIIRGIGKTAMDSGALPMTGGPDAIYDQSLKAINTGYNKLNPILAQTQEKLNQNLSDYMEASGHLGDKSANFLYQFRDTLSHDPDRNVILKKIQKKYIPYIHKMSKADGDLQALNTYKRALQDKATDLASAAYDQPASDLKPEAEFVKRLGGIVRQHIEDLASAADSGAGDQISEINKDLGNLYIYKNAAKKLMDKSTGGTIDNIKTGGVAGLGFLAGGPMGALASTAGKLGLEAATGNPVDRLAKIAGAKALNQVSKSIQTPAGQLVQKIVQSAPQASVASPFTQERVQQRYNPTEASKLSTNLYNATNDSLKDVASKFKATPGLEFYADHLNKAVDTDDLGEKDRAIFLIMQNPKARKLITPENK